MAGFVFVGSFVITWIFLSKDDDSLRFLVLVLDVVVVVAAAAATTAGAGAAVGGCGSVWTNGGDGGRASRK